MSSFSSRTDMLNSYKLLSFLQAVISHSLIDQASTALYLLSSGRLLGRKVTVLSWGLAGCEHMLPILFQLSQYNKLSIGNRMGNEPICAKDTRDFRSSTYIVCGKQPEFRNSTSINIINYVPVVTGPPLNFQKQDTFKKVEKSAAEFCQTNGLDQMYIPLVARIIAYGHNNIFMAYRRLPEHNKEQFLQEIKYADIDFLDSLYHKFILNERETKKAITPPPKVINRNDFHQKEKSSFYQTGSKLLLNGEVAFFFMCAGSSSRFMFQDKFLYPLELKSGKSLIQLLLERLRRNLRVPDNAIASVPIIFACNESNRLTVQNFLNSKKYAGFDSSKIRFLTVPNIPVLNQKGKLCLTFQYKILNRPSGTGKCIEQFLGSGLFNWLKNLQISTLHILGCENLIQNPGDPFLLGMRREKNLDIVGKCTDTLFPTEQFNRYSGGNDGKTYLINPQEILNSKINEVLLESLMEKCPISMNSIVCGLHQLKSITRDYQNSMFLSQEYSSYRKNENYYDFEKEKPMVSSPVFVFQKQIGHLFTCSTKYALLKVPRDEYIPIITKNGSYSMREGCKRLVEAHEQALNFSRVTE